MTPAQLAAQQAYEKAAEDYRTAEHGQRERFRRAMVAANHERLRVDVETEREEKARAA
jgi:hypothetical protein